MQISYYSVLFTALYAHFCPTSGDFATLDFGDWITGPSTLGSGGVCAGQAEPLCGGRCGDCNWGQRGPTWPAGLAPRKQVNGTLFLK